MERPYQDLVCVRGLHEGSVVRSFNARIFCLPQKFNLTQPDGSTKDSWYCEVYMPDHANGKAIFSRIIDFADNVLVTPIDRTMFDAMVADTPRDGAILEFGSGTTTSHLARERKIWSIEDKAQFIGAFNDPKYAIECPITEDIWYSVEVLKANLPAIKYDTIFVDGPDSDCRTDGLIKNLDLFDQRCSWYFDDYDNKEMRVGMEVIANRIGRPLIPFVNCAKPWAMIGRAA